MIIIRERDISNLKVGVILKSNKNKMVCGILYGVLWGLFSWIIFIRVNTSVVVFDSDMKALWLQPMITNILWLSFFFITYVKFCKYFISNLFIIPTLMNWLLIIFTVFVSNQIFFFKIMVIVGFLVYLCAFLIILKRTRVSTKPE